MEEFYENALVVNDGIKYQVEQYRNKVNEVVEYVRGMNVTSKDEAKNALNLACDAINLAEKIETVKDEIVQPAKLFQSEVSILAKEFMEKLAEVKQLLSEKIDEWKTSSCESGVLETATISAVEKSDISYEIENFESISKEFLMIDDKKVKLALKTGRKVFPGLKVVEKTKTTFRRK